MREKEKKHVDWELTSQVFVGSIVVVSPEEPPRRSGLLRLLVPGQEEIGKNRSSRIVEDHKQVAFCLVVRTRYQLASSALHVHVRK